MSLRENKAGRFETKASVTIIINRAEAKTETYAPREETIFQAVNESG